MIIFHLLYASSVMVQVYIVLRRKRRRRRTSAKRDIGKKDWITQRKALMLRDCILIHNSH